LLLITYGLIFTRGQTFTSQHNFEARDYKLELCKI
jgi:hypothetical protein